MSATNGSKAWDLRCQVREKLIETYSVTIQRACQGRAETSGGLGAEPDTKLRSAHKKDGKQVA